MSTGHLDWWFRGLLSLYMRFIELKDAPSSYEDQAGKNVRVNEDETGVEFGGAYLEDGLDAAKGDAGRKGRLYLATDTKILYEDDGVNWVERLRGESVTRLAELADKAHDSLSDVSSDQHHAQLHEGTHAHINLTGVSKDQHHNEDHHARHELLGADIVTPTIHHTRHETGGADEVAGLVFPLVLLNLSDLVMNCYAEDFDWTDVDISALTGADTAKAAILCVQTNLTVYVNEAANKYAMTEALFRKKGGHISTVAPKHRCCTGTATATNRGYGSATDNFIVEVDANEVFQAKLTNCGSQNPNVSYFYIYLVGYFK